MLKIAKFAVGASAVLFIPLSQAASVPLTSMTAPDAVSRSILAHPVRFEDGAVSNQDIPDAIHRNYPMIVEQNFARMNSTHSAAFVDQLSDVELQGIAQLYANANADAHRTGSLLLVAANRMDGPHLARLSKFFGYSPVYDAILSAAPLKAQSFAQSAPIAFAAPVVGALTPMMLAHREAAFSTAGAAYNVGGGATPMQFKPGTGNTFQELYTGFRGMQVGEMAPTAAFYETAVYAGRNLVIAWGAGYAFGTGLTWLAQTYTPDWYYGTFVNFVGGPVTWFQNTVLNLNSFSNNIPSLGTLEMNTAPKLGVPSNAQDLIGNTGGDFDLENAWESDYTGGGNACGFLSDHCYDR